MYIAVCDDNVADRKQTERLLKRESDARSATTGTLYVESFGNAGHILANPMVYDAFLLDVCQTVGTTTPEIVNALVEKGVQAPFILCSSKEDYTKCHFPEQATILHLPKPILVAQLRSTLDTILEMKSNQIPPIEIREEGKTHYVREEEIVAAYEEGCYTKIHMRDGSICSIYDKAYTFFGEIEGSHESFIMPSPKIILNCRYITRFTTLHRAVMTNQKKHSIPSYLLDYAKQMQAKYYQP